MPQHELVPLRFSPGHQTSESRAAVDALRNHSFSLFLSYSSAKYLICSERRYRKVKLVKRNGACLALCGKDLYASHSDFSWSPDLSNGRRQFISESFFHVYKENFPGFLFSHTMNYSLLRYGIASEKEVQLYVLG